MDDEIKSKLATSDLIGTVMGPGTHIKGSIHIKSSGRIDGLVEGEVRSDQDLIVGETGRIYGQITAKRAIIGGKVRGEVRAKLKVILENKADLKGDINTEKLQISEGAKFNGKCNMIKMV